MMNSKKLAGIIALLGIITTASNAQTVNGRVINNTTQGLEGKLVECWATSSGYQTLQSDVTNQTGYFSILVTDVEDQQSGIEGVIYTVVNNSVNIEINTLSREQVEIKLFDITGQMIYQLEEENFGIKTYTLPVMNLANAVYIVQVNLDNQTNINKLMNINNVIYFGKSSDTFNKKKLNKLNLETILDSIRVSGEAIETTTFHYGVSITGTYNVGNLVVDSLYINISGQIYQLFDWTQPNRGIEGATIQIGNKTATTGTDGNYSLNIPSGLRDVTITHPNTWTRKTKIIANQDATIDFNIMDKTRMPENTLAFYDTVFLRHFNEFGAISKRMTDTTYNFYITADITINLENLFQTYLVNKANDIVAPALFTPMYPEGFLKNILPIEVGTTPPSETENFNYISKLVDDLGGPFALSYIETNWDTASTQYLFGEIIRARSEYWRNMPSFETNMDRIAVHEITTPIASAFLRANSIPSVWNYGPPEAYKNMTQTDKYWLLFTFSRMPGNRSPDTDYYIYNADNGLWMKPEEIQNP